MVLKSYFPNKTKTYPSLYVVYYDTWMAGLLIIQFSYMTVSLSIYLYIETIEIIVSDRNAGIQSYRLKSNLSCIYPP